MPIFIVTYRNKDRTKNALVYGKNISHAKIKATKKAMNSGEIIKGVHPVGIQNKKEEMEMFFWQLGFFYESGIDIMEAIKTIQDNTKDINLHWLLNDMQECLQAGIPLSVAIRQHRGICGDLAHILFEVGEQSSRLPEICSLISEDIKARHNFANALRKALTYPCILMMALISAVVIVSIFIMPEFVYVYDHLEAPLPVLTRIMITLSSTASVYYYEAIICICACMILLRYVLKLKRIRDGLYLRIPIVRQIIIRYELYRYFLGLSILIRSKVPFMKSIQTCTDLIQNLQLRRELAKSIDSIKGGYPLSHALSNASIYIHNLMLIRSGEMSGKLDGALHINAQYYKKKYDNILENIHTLAEPIATIVMGLLIAFICLGVVTPMWNLLEIMG